LLKQRKDHIFVKVKVGIILRGVDLSGVRGVVMEEFHQCLSDEFTNETTDQKGNDENELVGCYKQGPFDGFDLHLAGHVHGDDFLEETGVLLVEHVAIEAAPVMGNQRFVFVGAVEGVDGELEVVDDVREVLAPLEVNLAIGVGKVDEEQVGVGEVLPPVYPLPHHGIVGPPL
jgi:hypothetical protein